MRPIRIGSRCRHADPRRVEGVAAAVALEVSCFIPLVLGGQHVDGSVGGQGGVSVHSSEGGAIAECVGSLQRVSTGQPVGELRRFIPA